MVFNRHLKALNLCNHSDTIACVLYELLVVSISKVAHFKALFFDWLIWNWLSWVSKPTFKVPQVSVLFNFQGPAALSHLCDSLYIIYQILSFVKRFSESFLKKFSSKNAYKLYLKASAAVPWAPPARQLWYITTPPYTLSTPFFGFFDKFWGRYLGKVYIADEWKYDYQMWVRGFSGLPVTGRYWETTGPGRPGPYRGGHTANSACGKAAGRAPTMW